MKRGFVIHLRIDLEEINRQENQEIEQKRNELISQHPILTFQEYIDEKNGVIKA